MFCLLKSSQSQHDNKEFWRAYVLLYLKAPFTITNLVKLSTVSISLQVLLSFTEQNPVLSYLPILEHVCLWTEVDKEKNLIT